MRGGALGAFGKSVVKGVLYSFTHIYFNSPSCDLARPPSRQHQHILPYRNVPQGPPIRACQGCVLPRNTSSRPNASPVPDVPGPNAYNIPQGRFSQSRPAIQTQTCLLSESMLDNYKRGAFLEKTDRFAKEKSPLQSGRCLPEPIGHPRKLISAAEPTHKPSSSVAQPTRPASNQSATERYNLLQKKVDDLEKVHLEGKKAVCHFSSTPETPYQLHLL